MPNPDDKSLYKKIKERQTQLEATRRPHEDVWADVILLLRSELSKWGAETEAVGQRRNLEVYSAGPEEAVENWANGTQGHLVSSSLDWFNYQMAQRQFNEFPEVREWRQGCVEEIYSIFRHTNFYATLTPIFRDACTIGDTTLWMDRKDDRDIDFKSFHPREVYHAPGIFHRRFKITAFEAVEQFDRDKLSQVLLNNLEKNPFEKHEFIQTCYLKSDPIFTRESDVPDREYVSVYIEFTTDKEFPVRIAGYRSKPYANWRYSLASDSEYGWGLGCSAIVDVAALNAAARTNMQAEQMAVDPPVLAHSALRGRINFKPHGQTFFNDPAETVKPIMENLNIPFGLDREDRLAEAINRRFNVDFFLMLARAEKPMTATEILERTAERSVLLGPMIGRMETDLLNPVHERVFAIALEEGWLPEPPPILLEQSDGRIDVEYIGPLAQAQRKLLGIRQTQQTMETLAPMVQINPGILDNIDMDKTTVRILRDDDFPEDEIRKPEEVAAIREAREKAAAEAQQLEIAKEAADAVPKLSKEIEPNSVLAGMGAGE